MSVQLYLGDCLDWARDYDGPPFHAALCDPPYELAFMGKSWDATGVVFQSEMWAALAAHLLPGAFLMAFGGSRTYHRLACAIEDAGFIIHPAIVWVYGSGFPKATRIDTQVDKAAGAEREVIGFDPAKYRPNRDKYLLVGQAGSGGKFGPDNGATETAPATDLARAWAGHRYGLQTLKPAAEFICVAQKPYQGKPVECITRTGAGALNIDGGRVNYQSEADYDKNANFDRQQSTDTLFWKAGTNLQRVTSAGRWPANFCLDEAAAALLDELVGERKSGGGNGHRHEGANLCMSGKNYERITLDGLEASAGGPSRFYYIADWSYEVAEQIDAAEPWRYCAKASRAERDAGLSGMPPKLTTEQDKWATNDRRNGTARQPTEWKQGLRHNPHPTVKPISLCRWLSVLLLPPARYAPRRILVPFAGSGSECIGAGLAGWEEIVGIEREAEYVEIAEARLAHWLAQQQLSLPGVAR